MPCPDTLQPVANTKALLIYGNPADGFTFVGPFDDSEAAHEHLEHNPVDDEWWIAPLVDPCNPDGSTPAGEPA